MEKTKLGHTKFGANKMSPNIAKAVPKGDQFATDQVGKTKFYGTGKKPMKY